MGLFGWSRGKPLCAGADAGEVVTGPVGSTPPAPAHDESPDPAARQMNPAGNGRVRAATNGQGAAGGNGAAGGSAAAPDAPLREGLQRLFAQRPSREQFAEEALQLIATTAGVKVAALLGYEPRSERIRLLGSVGLEADAVEVLSADSHVNIWDMPLRGLKNQRINVIESAHENPFVPKPLVAISPRKLTIAIIPFYHSGVPIGVLLLFSATLRGFSNSLLHTISGALRVCGLALAQLSETSAAPEGPSEEADQQPTLLRGLNALKVQLAHLTKALEAAERERATEAAERVTAESFLRAERERLVALERELAATHAARTEIQAALQESAETLAASQTEVRTLTADLAEVRARAERLETQQQAEGDLRREIESIETKRAALQRTIKTLRQQLTDAAHQQEEAARAAESRVADLEAERDRLAAEIGRLRDQSGQTVSELHEQIESIERDRLDMAQHIEALAHAESERARLQARVEEIDQDLVAAHEAARAREAHVQDLSETTARLIAERAELQARVETLAAGGQTLEQEKQAAMVAAHRRISQVEDELNRLTAALEATRASAASEVSQMRAAADQELRAVRGELAAAARARESLERDIAQAHHELGVVRHESVALAAEGERLKAELAQLGKGREVALAESEQMRAAAAELEGQIQASLEAKDALAAQLNEQLAEMTLRQDALEQEHRAERERLLHTLTAKDLLLQAAEDRLSIDIADAEEDVDSMLAIERSGGETQGEAEAGPQEPGAAAEHAVTSAARELVIIDGCGLGDDTARRLAEFGCRITAVAPAPDLPAQLVGRQPVCAAVNLATPSAWQTVRVLRNGRGNPGMSFVTYALAAGATTGFWFGAVDFVVLPAHEGELCDALARMAPRAKRVIAMSTDIDVMSDVRAQLSGKGVSTAVVLDGRQALDLLPTIRPEAAILHLSPRCADVFRAIAGLRNTDASRNIPILFLLDPTAHAQEESFLSSGLRLLSGRGNLPSDDLVNALAAAFAEYHCF